MTEPRPGDIIFSDAYAEDARETLTLFESMDTQELLVLYSGFETSLRIIDGVLKDPKLIMFAAGRIALIAAVLRSRNQAPVPPMDVFAWVGEDERGSGVVGIKMVLDIYGPTPLVCIASHRDRFQRQAVVAALQDQVNAYGKTIRFARFTHAEDLLVLTSRGNS